MSGRAGRRSAGRAQTARLCIPIPAVRLSELGLTGLTPRLRFLRDLGSKTQESTRTCPPPRVPGSRQNDGSTIFRRHDPRHTTRRSAAYRAKYVYRTHYRARTTTTTTRAASTPFSPTHARTHAPPRAPTPLQCKPPETHRPHVHSPPPRACYYSPIRAKSSAHISTDNRIIQDTRRRSTYIIHPGV